MAAGSLVGLGLIVDVFVPCIRWLPRPSAVA
jgi:hypothetical protein